MGVMGMGGRSQSLVARGSALLLITAASFAACSGSSSNGAANGGGQAAGGQAAGESAGAGGVPNGSVGENRGGDAGADGSAQPEPGGGAGAGTLAPGGAAGASNAGAGGAADATGSGGAAGAIGSADAGAGGTSEPLVLDGSKLGSSCTADADCGGLKCLKPTDSVLNGGSAPKGLCTTSCTLPTDAAPTDSCATLGDGALCYPFNPGDTTGYCIEGCAFGAPGLGQPAKCHGRAEFACNPALVAPTNEVCKVETDCGPGELCSDGLCNVVFPGCLPACGGDVDCSPGYHCDQSFLSGVCIEGSVKGKALGEPCTVPAADEPAEPDECLGYCAADSAGSTKGHCASTCSYGSPCSWNTDTQKYDGACVLVNSQVVTTPDVGDFGFCALTCNCDKQCLDASLGCELLDEPLPQSYRGGGFCFQPSQSSVPYDVCD